jgi:uncharacterized membrane protein YeaQ/YmgE (transglycosylase-associated protein family)
MGIISWLLVGLIAGVLAKLIILEKIQTVSWRRSS